MNTLQRTRKFVFQVNTVRYLPSQRPHQLFEVLHKVDIIVDKVQEAKLLQMNNLLVLSCPSFIRINPSFIEHVVFLFLHLFDNCCNSYSPNREDGVSAFSAIWGNRQQLSNLLLISRQKRGPGRGQLKNNCPLFVWRNQDNFKQSVINLRKALIKVGGSSLPCRTRKSAMSSLW